MRAIARHWPALLLLVIAAAFLAIGVLRGEADTVFRKAATICLECIGIG